MASQHTMRIRSIQNMIAALEYMECELQYRCTPLPLLCRKVADHSQGKVRLLFSMLADELDAQISPDVYRCMTSVIGKLCNADKSLCDIATEMGRNLGMFDLSGQLRGLESTRNLCREKLDNLLQNKDSRLRSYQTLCLCAGAALAILLV